MCGIAGIFSYSDDAPRVNQEELLNIRDRMVSRGPDGAGLWLSENEQVGLAHRRLSIVDLTDAGHQPMATSDGRFYISFNGEIYNFRTLRAELELKGCVFHSHTDTEVILHLYRLEGEAMLLRLRGMFAIAIWDEQVQSLFLARDSFGIKPLYYADDGKTIRFASQVKALLASSRVDTSPEPAGIVGFYLWGSVPEPYTRFKGIRALPAGSWLKISGTGRKEQKQFFSLRDELLPPQQPILTTGEALEQLHEAVRDSVRHHLIADIPVGAFLSAGLDSCTLVALAKQAGVADLRTLTLGFKEFAGTQNDETQLACVVADHYSTHHQTQWVQRDDFLSQLEPLLDAMDQPSIDGVNSYFVCKAAKEAGLKAVLSGLGGDELLGGYPSFQGIPKMVNTLRPFAHFPCIGKGFRYVSAPILKHFTSPKWAGLLEYGTDYAGAYLLRRGLYMPYELPNVLDCDLVREGWLELNTLQCLRGSIDGVSNARLKVSALETAWYMRNQLLRDADWASMAHSLELRVPLVDVELFRTVTRLVRAGHAPSKQDMAMSPIKPLPDSIINRPKTGFSVPVREWLVGGDAVAKRGLRGWAGLVVDR
jgi:asparagine synthase (glutamine-hydrolysing)